ncbi:MAG TPA: FtsH protease activity modulator HflK [Steroidobacteraceae bacterium]|jgi:membrane protease subunit HflK
MAWNRPYQAQNDLDDMLRNLQRRLASIFGRSGGGMSSSSGPQNVNRALAGVLVLIVAVWVASGMYSVDAQEKGVVLRFGKYVETVGPGYNWHLPWPIDRVILVNVSQWNSITDDSSVLTADTNLVHVQSTVQFTQPDPIKVLFTVRDPSDTLRQVAESAMREAIGQAALDQALAFNPSITRHAMALMNSTLDKYDIGIHVLSVTLQNVNVPDAVHEAQLDALQAPKDGQRYQQEAETYRNDLLPRARGAATKEVVDAEAYRQQVVAIAQGETSRFDQVLAQYEHAPAVTRERIYLETMESVYKNARKVVIDTKNGNSMMYLPLDKLLAPQLPGLSAAPDGVSAPRLPEVQVAPLDDASRSRGTR